MVILLSCFHGLNWNCSAIYSFLEPSLHQHPSRYLHSNFAAGDTRRHLWSHTGMAATRSGLEPGVGVFIGCGIYCDRNPGAVARTQPMETLMNDPKRKQNTITNQLPPIS